MHWRLPGIALPFRCCSAAGPHAWSVRRTSLLALGAGGVAAMLAACGGSSKSSSPSTNAARPSPVTRSTTQQQESGGAAALKAETASAATVPKMASGLGSGVTIVVVTVRPRSDARRFASMASS